MTYSWSVLRISVARLILILATSLLLSSSHADTVFGQSLSGFDRGNAKAMLAILKDDIKNNYYDKSFRGIDLDKRFKDAELALNEAQTRDQLMAIVAQALIDFNDSHTVFIPPSRSSMIQYGWQMQMIGDYGFITEVRPGSDAEAKGLKRGDVILSVDGFQPDRANMWKMLYRYYAIMPSRSVNLVVQSPYESKTRSLDILSKIKPGKAVVDYGDLFVRYLSQERDIDHDRDYEIGDDVFIWKMPTFEVSSDHVDALMNKASKYKTLILDLRSNSGGYVQTLERLAGYFIEKDTKIAELKGRKVMKPLMAKSRGDKSFKGKLIVLVDSGSASASEVFARFCQLEKRCTVLGDRTEGAVMQARYFGHETGVGQVLYFGANITNADIIMSDGQSVENVGVSPDELIKPSGKELASRHDPVLSRAVKLAGNELDPIKAGSLFPFEWPKN